MNRSVDDRSDLYFSAYPLSNADRNGAVLRKRSARVDLCPFGDTPDSAERRKSDDPRSALRAGRQAHGEER